MKHALILLVLVACNRKQVAVQCERSIEGLNLSAGRIVWLGEMHGTMESPKFVGDVVCQGARAASVQLGLEIATAEQMRIDRFLVDGKRDSLLAGPWWRQHDGRSSTAMLALIERIRELRRGGAKVSIVAYDALSLDGRDTAMANFVRAARKPDHLFIGLSGNVHSRRTKWNDMTPLVAQLVAHGLGVKTYDVSASGGTFWGCMSHGDHEPICGEHPMGIDREKGTPWTIGARRDESHDGVYFVGKTTASPPARR